MKVFKRLHLSALNTMGSTSLAQWRSAPPPFPQFKSNLDLLKIGNILMLFNPPQEHLKRHI